MFVVPESTPGDSDAASSTKTSGFINEITESDKLYGLKGPSV